MNYLMPLDVFLPDVLLAADVAMGDEDERVFENLDVHTQSDYMQKSDYIIERLRPYLAPTDGEGTE